MPPHLSFFCRFAPSCHLPSKSCQTRSLSHKTVEKYPAELTTFFSFFHKFLFKDFYSISLFIFKQLRIVLALRPYRKNKFNNNQNEVTQKKQIKKFNLVETNK